MNEAINIISNLYLQAWGVMFRVLKLKSQCCTTSIRKVQRMETNLFFSLSLFAGLYYEIQCTDPCNSKCYRCYDIECFNLFVDICSIFLGSLILIVKLVTSTHGH